MFRTALVALAFSLLATAGPAQTNGQLTVSATATVSSAPDMAVVSVGVGHQDREARAALTAMNTGTEAVIGRLSALGVAPEDMQTAALNLQPFYENSSRGQAQVAGYRAETVLTVRVRDLDRLGEILDTVVGDGANRLSGLRFTIADPEPLMVEARRLAVARAMAKAAELSEAAGTQLGSILMMSEQGQDRPMALAEFAESRAGGVPLAGGEVGLSATVSMTYQLSD